MQTEAKIDSKLKFNRRDWKPDGYTLHRIDIFMVNVKMPCKCGSDCCSGFKHMQRCVVPRQDGKPNFNGADTFMSPEDIEWCKTENLELLRIFPTGHDFWLKGI